MIEHALAEILSLAEKWRLACDENSKGEQEAWVNRVLQEPARADN
jgi:hypothetical protein